jgi:hypothetical protein
MNHLRTGIAGVVLLAAISLLGAIKGVFAAEKSHVHPGITNTTIPLTLFGIHVNSTGDAEPPSGWFGQQRLWDTATNWYQIETQAPLTITNVARTNGTSTITVSSSTAGWSVNSYVYVTGTPNNSFVGLYQITGVTSSTISYSQSGLGNVTSNSSTGSANYYVFSTLDAWLQKAKSQGMQVMYTFGKTPSFYSSDSSGSCASNPAGSCYPPSDLNTDGTGPNAYWRLFVTALAQHLASLSTSTYAIPGYFETWNEANSGGMWQGTNDQLVRLMDDAACILKGTGTITALSVSCSSASGFLAKGVLNASQMLQPVMSSPNALSFWNSYYATSGATANADIISVHGYGYGDHIQALGTNSLVRSSNGQTVTVTLSSHGFVVNTVVLISGASPTSFNGTFTITATTTNTFTYSQSGTANQQGSGGQVQNGPDQLQKALANFVATLSTTDKGKPFWVTEGQWGLASETTDPTTQKGYAPRWFAILWSAGVSRANWYGWDLTNGSGVMWQSSNVSGDIPCDGSGTPSYTCNPSTEPGAGYVEPNGEAFQVESNWMYNNKMTTLCSNIGSVWTCTFTTPGSTTQEMVWDSAQDKYTSATATYSNFNTPTGYSHYYDWMGTEHNAGTTVPIGAIPILLVP